MGRLIQVVITKSSGLASASASRRPRGSSRSAANGATPGRESGLRARPVNRHGLAADAVLMLAGFYAFAALVHHYLSHDDLLGRMSLANPAVSAGRRETIGEARRR